MRVSTAAQAGPTPTRAWLRQRSDCCIASVSQEKRFSLRQEMLLHAKHRSVSSLNDIDMKKDIEVLIAEERAQIISKYAK
ncbi:hypothetical protein KOW79_021287, partial [Hemibagrus wyckioides]